MANTKTLTNSSYFGIKLPDELKRKVCAAADRKGFVVSDWIRKALERVATEELRKAQK